MDYKGAAANQRQGGEDFCQTPEPGFFKSQSDAAGITGRDIDSYHIVCSCAYG